MAECEAAGAGSSGEGCGGGCCSWVMFVPISQAHAVCISGLPCDAGEVMWVPSGREP